MNKVEQTVDAIIKDDPEILENISRETLLESIEELFELIDNNNNKGNKNEFVQSV